MMKSISTSTEDGDNSQSRKVQWPFGRHAICKVLEIQMPKFYEPGDFQIVAKNDGIFVEEVNTQGLVFQKLYPGDKILAFDETDYTTIDSLAAYQDATRRIELETVNITQLCRIHLYLLQKEDEDLLEPIQRSAFFLL